MKKHGFRENMSTMENRAHRAQRAHGAGGNRIESISGA